jgi:hypothetical protein
LEGSLFGKGLVIAPRPNTARPNGALNAVVSSDTETGGTFVLGLEEVFVLKDKR